MKSSRSRVPWTVAALFVATAFIGSAQGSITNTDVIKMAKAGLGDQVIVASIQGSARTDFDTSATALIALKQAGVSDTVLTAMVGATKGAPAASSESTKLERPGSMPAGIYVDIGVNGKRQLVQLEPTVISRVHTAGVFGSAMTMGIAKAKVVAELRGSQAALRINQQTPTFYFYFNSRNNPVDNAFVGWLASASSPNEFVLLQMYKEKDRREMDVAKGNAFGSSSGVESENTVSVKIEKLGPAEYRVTPTEPLGRGEFCFFYAAGAATLQSGPVAKLFDFGVD
jgi:hypothetical protein